MPIISIIVPAYNAEKTIGHTINSILKQSYKDFELIIVNDGSFDNTLEVCKNFLDERITIINQKNSGLSCARNTGIQNSIGDYICFIDSDDYIEVNYLEYLYKSIHNTKSDLAICGIKISDTEFTSSSCFTQDEYISCIWLNDDFLSFFQKGLLNSVCNKLYKSEIIKKNHIIFPIQVITEDIAFNINYLFFSKSISTIKEALYIYQLQNSQLTKKVSEDMFTNYLKIHTNLLNIVPANKHIYVHQFVYNQYVSIIIRYLSHINDQLLNKQETFIILDKYLSNPLIKQAFSSFHSNNYKEFILHHLMKNKFYTLILLYLKK